MVKFTDYFVIICFMLLLLWLGQEQNSDDTALWLLRYLYHIQGVVVAAVGDDLRMRLKKYIYNRCISSRR